MRAADPSLLFVQEVVRGGWMLGQKRLRVRLKMMVLARSPQAILKGALCTYSALLLDRTLSPKRMLALGTAIGNQSAS